MLQVNDINNIELINGNGNNKSNFDSNNDNIESAGDNHVTDTCSRSNIMSSHPSLSGRFACFQNAPNALETLISNHILSRLDYCNTLYHALSKCLQKKLQRLQNSASRLITRTKQRERITPALI